MSEHSNVLSLLASDNPEDIREGAHLAGMEQLKEAIPALVKHIDSSNIGVQEAVDRALRKIGGPVVVNAVIPLLRSDEAPVRNISMDLLRALGSSDFEALSNLLNDDDADIRIFASDILGSVGTVMAVPPLCKALLHDPEVNVRYQAAVSLGALAYPEAAKALNHALQDEEWVQFAVIEALTKIGAESSVQAMIKALGNSTDLVASMIVDALGEMGNMKAIPLLLKKLDSSPTPLGNKIVRAVIRIMGEDSLTLLGAKDCQRLLGYLHPALDDEDPEIQDAALKGFAVLGGKDATGHILKLAEGLDMEKDAQRIQDVLTALVKVGNAEDLEKAVREGSDHIKLIAVPALIHVDEKKAVAVLMDVFWDSSRDMQRYMIMEMASHAGLENQNFFLDVLKRHEDGNVLRGALLFLGHVGDSRKVQEQIIPLLAHPYNDVKEAALEALVLLHTPELEEFFRELARNEDPIQRIMAIYALSNFDSEKFIEEFKAALSDPSPDVRRVAVESFGRGCNLSDERISLLEERFNDENQDVRMAVVDTLGACSDERLTSSLLKGLDDPAPWVQVRCIERLGEKRIHQAAERLVDMLASDNQLIVIKSVEALGHIGGETAFRALMPFLNHPDPDLQEAASQAVDSIRMQAGE